MSNMKRALLLKIHVLILFFINIYCFAIPQNIFDFDNDTVDIVKMKGETLVQKKNLCRS